MFQRGAMIVSFLVAIQQVQAATVTVPGTANIFGAGHSGVAATPAPGGGAPGGGNPGGSAPPSVAINGGNIVTFSVTGAVRYNATLPPEGPDGRLFSDHTFASINGVSGIQLDRAQVLLGVFVGATEPSDPPPASLNFVGNTAFTTLSPQLDQLFFIGDGLTELGTGLGTRQQFIAPSGTTQLYLGMVDGVPGSGGLYFAGWYNDNSGAFLVDVSAIPEPTVWILMSGPLLNFGLIRRRRSGIYRKT
jgi:hypothetical protein